MYTHKLHNCTELAHKRISLVNIYIPSNIYTEEFRSVDTNVSSSRLWSWLTPKLFGYSSRCLCYCTREWTYSTLIILLSYRCQLSGSLAKIWMRGYSVRSTNSSKRTTHSLKLTEVFWTILDTKQKLLAHVVSNEFQPPLQVLNAYPIAMAMCKEFVIV